MPIPLLVLIGLHIVASAFWLFSSAVLGWGGNPKAAATMVRPQMIAAVLVMFAGGGLWQTLHAGVFGPREAVLGAGAVLAVAAAGVQSALVSGSARRLRTGVGAEGALVARMARGERIGAVLLLLAFACMMGERLV